MIKIILPIIIYIFFGILPFYTKAVNTEHSSNSKSESESESKFKIKDIETTMTCYNCCTLNNDKVCYIIYSACNTERYKNAIFMITSTDLTDSKIFSKIKKHTPTYYDNLILILTDKRVYFSATEYPKLATELDRNINRLKNSDVLSNSQVYKSAREHMSVRFENGTKIKRLASNIFLYRNIFNNIYDIFKIYHVILGLDENQIIKLYNKDFQQTCNKYNLKNIVRDNKTISTLKPSNTNTMPSIVSVLPVTLNNSLVNNNISCCGNKNLTLQKYSTTSSNNFSVIAIVITSIAVPIVIVIVVIFIYTKYKNYKTTRTTVSSTESIEHIYEEPYDVPIKHYTTTDIPINHNSNNQNYNTNSNIEITAKSEEHIYLPCIDDNDVQSKIIDSANDLINTLHIDNDNNLDEQQEELAIPTEDNISNHTYNVLENEDSKKNNSYDNIIHNNDIIENSRIKVSDV